MGLPSGQQPLLQTHLAGNKELLEYQDSDYQRQQHEQTRTQVSKGDAPADRRSFCHWAGQQTE